MLGKFNNVLESALYAVSLDGSDTVNDGFDGQGTSYTLVAGVQRVELDADIDAEDLPEIAELWAECKGDDGNIHAILIENSQGLVSAEYYNSADEATAEFERISDEISAEMSRESGE